MAVILAELSGALIAHVLGLPALEGIERVDELIQGHVAAAHSDYQPVVLAFHKNFFFAVSVHPFLLSDEEKFGLF